jgi:hypothetical protein
VKLRATITILCLTALVLFIEACSRPTGPQPSCNFVQNPEQQRVSGKGRLPVKLYVHNSVPQEAYASIDQAIAQFNTDIGHGQELLKIIARGVSGDLNPIKDGYSTIYWFNTWDPARPTEQARTTIYWSGNEIFEADMRVNAKNFTYNYDGAVANFTSTQVDLVSLLVHEFGHVLGLAHTTAAGSAMHATLDEGQVRRTLGAIDLTDLHCEY